MVPVIAVTPVAVTNPVVFPFKVFNTAAVTALSVTVTASAPNPVIPPAVRTVFRSAAAPLIVVTAVAVTFTVVAPSIAINLAAVTDVSPTVIV